MRQSSHLSPDSIHSSSLILGIWLMACLLGCGSQESADPLLTASISAPAEQAASDPDPLHPVVRIQTSAGTIEARLDVENTPGTVQNFLDYVNEGFYSGTLIHYVQPGSMILGGGYDVDGALKPTRVSIRNEAHNGAKNKRGTLAMARDPDLIDSATTQFFINLDDAPNLDFGDESPQNYGYCVFGTVTEGMDVADRIAQAPTQDRGGDLFQSPRDPIVIESIRVLQ